jgi:NAD(P)H-dependent FMN reductase
MSLTPPNSLTILAISGSLRASSSNTALLRAAKLAPENVQVTLYEGLGDLPHFNPDLDGENVAATVTDFRERLREADAVLICSPEYAHGVPGVLKNGLDWIVGSGEFMEKPVGLINASVASFHAHESLKETLTVMMAKVLPAASPRVALRSNRTTVDEMVADERVAGLLREAVEALASSAKVPPKV